MFERASVLRPDDFLAPNFLASVLSDMGLAAEAEVALQTSMRRCWQGSAIVTGRSNTFAARWR